MFFNRLDGQVKAKGNGFVAHVLKEAKREALFFAEGKCGEDADEFVVKFFGEDVIFDYPMFVEELECQQVELLLGQVKFFLEGVDGPADDDGHEVGFDVECGVVAIFLAVVPDVCKCDLYDVLRNLSVVCFAFGDADHSGEVIPVEILHRFLRHLCQ